MCSLRTIRGCEVCVCGVSMARTSRGVSARKLKRCAPSRPCGAIDFFLRATRCAVWSEYWGGEGISSFMLLVEPCF